MYNEINDKYNDIDRRVEDIREQEEKDFGPDDVFLSMYKKCFELKTTEYIYKVQQKINVWSSFKQIFHDSVRF